MSADRPEAEVVLRPAVSDEGEALTAVFLAARRAAVPELPPPVHTEVETRAWFDAQLSDPIEREVWVAESGGEIVAFTMLDRSWLHSLYVAPDATGQGIGSALLDLTKALRPNGFGLWVFETNLRAQSFYSRHGLVVAERTDGSENEERQPDLRMVWSGDIQQLRSRIDEVDDALAVLLEERARLTARIQDGKPVPGHAGRDRVREAQIVDRMTVHAPTLGAQGVARIMDAVISASLDAAESSSPPQTME